MGINYRRAEQFRKVIRFHFCGLYVHMKPESKISLEDSLGEHSCILCIEARLKP